MGAHSKHVDVQLECGHFFRFEKPWVPTPGDIIYCNDCKAERQVIAPAYYRSNCRDCLLQQSFGSRQNDALAHLQLHAATFAHTIDLYNGSFVVATVVAS